MKKNPFILGTASFLGMLILILDGKTALAGVKEGIDLCLKTVIPSLFPFFVLSALMTSSLSGSSLGVVRPLGRLLGIPDGAESLMISGLLGGYPVGAQAIAGVWRSGSLSKANAERLLSFCNNAGPAFLFGMAASMFPRKWMAWSLWGIHILSAAVTALLIPADIPAPIKMQQQKGTSFPEALNIAVRVMSTVCGWILLFRMIIAFLRRWILWLLPLPWQTAVIGLLELSNGCIELSAVADVPIRFVLCSGILAFGGLCVTMQTATVTQGLSLKYYLSGKALQTLFSLLLSSAVMAGIGHPCALALLLTAFFLGKRQKKSSIQAGTGV